ncbi:redoxin domain-containing protein [Metabacillus litoralis]|uniref:Redoxin domain-containing protein n=1 Tax=Metabacillus litoralis TaxID=152268 RepID=A0A5C6W903_9BACI|nr:redoxin domain-containing protein [Metabacillus litoralis]
MCPKVLICVTILLIITGCGNSTTIKDPLNFEIQSFQFTNQNGESVSLDDLKGQVWVADFIFTNCETVCPPMTAHMKELQSKAKAEDLDVRMVSFSVDPKVDTPEKLKEFAANYSITYDNWDFLTGYEQKEIEDFAMESFKTIVQKPQDSDQVIHVSNFYLIDKNGVIMKDYSGVTDTPYDQIIADIKTLSK